MRQALRPIQPARWGMVFLSGVVFSLSMFALPTSAQNVSKPEDRCGWFTNPTPANAWLIDRDGQWTISVQGGHQAEGYWPEFPAKQWVRTNAGSYGYGCACVKVLVDRETKYVKQIVSSKTKPLAACKKDKSLTKKP
jgi:hypothetical protein